MWKVVTLRRKHTLRVFGKRVLRKISGPKREGVMGGLQKVAH
jgi:hypothetical protein